MNINSLESLPKAVHVCTTRLTMGVDRFRSIYWSYLSNLCLLICVFQTSRAYRVLDSLIEMTISLAIPLVDSHCDLHARPPFQPLLALVLLSCQFPLQFLSLSDNHRMWFLIGGSVNFLSQCFRILWRD